jgi:hypothetical protein
MTDIVARLDKACGKSFIAENKECSKPTTAIAKAPKSQGFPTKRVAAAAIAGVSAATYLTLAKQYREGFKESARIAMENSKKVEVPDIPDSKKAVTFTVGGFYGYEGDAAARKGEDYLDYKMGQEVLGSKDDPGGEHFMVKHRNEKFNVTESGMSGPQSHVRDHIKHYSTIMKPMLQLGRNPEAVDLAAKAIAFHQKYPDKQINLVGHSAGGMINHEAAEILKNAKVPVNVVNLGTGFFGLTPSDKNQHTIAFESDLYLKTLIGGVKNPVWVGKGRPLSADDHRVRSYVNDPEVRAKLKELLTPKRRADAINPKAQAARILSPAFNGRPLSVISVSLTPDGIPIGVFKGSTRPGQSHYYTFRLGQNIQFRRIMGKTDAMDEGCGCTDCKKNKRTKAECKCGGKTDADPCWKGYEQVGMKRKGKKQVPNCVPTETKADSAELSGLKRNGDGKVYYQGRWWKPNEPVESTAKGKKKMVLAVKNGKVKIVHFGADGYGHNYSESARKSYLARSAGIKGTDDKHSANYWARKVLWAGKGGSVSRPKGDALLERLDKACGESFIPDDAKCTKPPKAATGGKPNMRRLALGAGVVLGSYAALGLSAQAAKRMKARRQQSANAQSGNAPTAAPVSDPNWNKTLGVDKNASAAEIKAAFRKKAKETHPDVGGSPEEFAKVHKAWEAAQTLGKVRRGDSIEMEWFIKRLDALRKVAT